MLDEQNATIFQKRKTEFEDPISLIFPQYSWIEASYQLLWTTLQRMIFYLIGRNYRPKKMLRKSRKE